MPAPPDDIHFAMPLAAAAELNRPARSSAADSASAGEEQHASTSHKYGHANKEQGGTEPKKVHSKSLADQQAET
jgi:hypothetical protein